MSNQDAPISSDQGSLKQQAIIAEYASLRDEIAGRTRDQLVCVTASFITISALLSTVATDPVKFSGLLVVVPWILAVFGILWCDHAHAIHLIAVYLREEIEQKKMPGLVGGVMPPETIGWETYLQNRRQESAFLGFINILLPMLYFALPSVVAFVAYLFLRFRGETALPRVLEYSFIGLGAILFAALIFSWRRAYRLSGR